MSDWYNSEAMKAYKYGFALFYPWSSVPGARHTRYQGLLALTGLKVQGLYCELQRVDFLTACIPAGFPTEASKGFTASPH